MKSVFDYSLKDKLKDKQVVIYGWTGDARTFALRLLQENISFDFFLNIYIEECLQPRLLNKPIISLDECKQKKDIVIIVSYQKAEEARCLLEDNGLGQYLIEIEQYHHLLKGESGIAIYGTGSRASAFYKQVQDILSVRCFVDSYKKGSLYGKDIIVPAELPQLPEDTAIVIASVHTREIYNTLIQNGIDCEKIFFIEYQFLIDAGQQQYRFPMHCFYYAVMDAYVRKQGVIIYGIREVAYALKQKFELINIQINKVVTREAIEEDGTIFQLAYEDMRNQVCIIADHYSETAQNALKQMGIADNHFIWLERHHWFWVADKEQICECLLDPHLGHVHARDGEAYAGFMKYEWDNGTGTKKVRILLLGGSTTSSFRVRQTPWCQYLSDCLKEEGISHIIYNGGIESYRATQELIKLIRDGIWLSPDMVISYSGINNMKETFVGPASSDYQEILFKSITAQFHSDIDGLGKPKNVSWGVQSEVSAFDYWFSQIKMQKAICGCWNIKYFSFLQPTLFTKKIESDYDIDLDAAAYIGYLYDKEKNEFFCTEAVEESRKVACDIKKEFRERGKEIRDTWFCDLSQIFDNRENVYMDDNHIYDWANNVLAQKIFDKIKGALE
ncbi:MAG: hypothetical protein HFH72_08450 [Lachnospiraceae bacterium]|nr:hypothetical protein [Lachnospiraceae bacterium]